MNSNVMWAYIFSLRLLRVCRYDGHHSQSSPSSSPFPRRTVEQKKVEDHFPVDFLGYSLLNLSGIPKAPAILLMHPHTILRTFFSSSSHYIWYFLQGNRFLNTANLRENPPLPWRNVLPIPTFSFAESRKICCRNVLRNPATSCEYLNRCWATGMPAASNSRNQSHIHLIWLSWGFATGLCYHSLFLLADTFL